MNRESATQAKLSGRLVAVLVGAMFWALSAQPAHADVNWPSPEPIGSFQIAAYCGQYCISPWYSAGGEVSYRGSHLLLTVAHGVPAVGTGMYEWRPTYGPYLGLVQYRNPNSDTAEIQLSPPAGGGGWRPALHISNSELQMPVMYGSNGRDLHAGDVVCQSGWSNETQMDGGKECGPLDQNCVGALLQCSFTAVTGKAALHGGDSGAPVWRYVSGGVELLGIAHAGLGYVYPNGYNTAFFVPIQQYLSEYPGMCVSAYDWWLGQTGCA